MIGFIIKHMHLLYIASDISIQIIIIMSGQQQLHHPHRSGRHPNHKRIGCLQRMGRRRRRQFIRFAGTRNKIFNFITSIHNLVLLDGCGSGGGGNRGGGIESLIVFKFMTRITAV